MSANSLRFKNSLTVETIWGQMNYLTYMDYNTQNNLTLDTKNKKKDKQGQFIIQPKTKHKTGLVFMKSQNKQTQRSKLRIPVLDKHFEVE